MRSDLDTSRITSREVIKALKKEKLLPMAGVYRIEVVVGGEVIVQGACALGVLYGHFGPSEETAYFLGIQDGFDGDPPEPMIVREHERGEYFQGFCDGVKIHVDALRALKLLKGG